MESLKRKISFDGNKFWLAGICCGNVKLSDRFNDIDKETMHKYKEQVLEQIIDYRRW